MTVTPPEELRAWVGEASGPEAVEEFDAGWVEFSARDEPVATLFGAFDTGKSSILRRLLVDAGQQIPDWLTISARHETFANEIVQVDGCAVRDTPGLSPDGEDARSLKNSQVARTSLGLTDVLLVTLNPQLPTGERSELLEILSQPWPESSVWFLISRADEGGIDPTSDPTGFEAWAQRKQEELRESLHLDEANPIYVVIPDFGQLGAYVANPESSTWDISRPWDGMDQLRAALAELSGRDLTESRRVAGIRYWQVAVSQRVTGLQTELADLRTSRDAAISSLRRRDLFLQQLDSLVDAARVSLEGAMEEAIRRVLMQPHIDADTLQSTADPVFEEWWRGQQAALVRIRQDAIRAFDQQRLGRAWATFESLYAPVSTAEQKSAPAERSFTPQFEKLGRQAAEALNAIDGVRRAQQKVANPGATAESAKSVHDWKSSAGLVSAVLPLAVELAGMIEDRARKKVDEERERARRQQLEDEVNRLVEGAADQAMQTLEPDVEALRQEIAEQTIGPHEVDDLEAAVGEASDLVARADALLAD